jgi:site-specific recombinase XerD
MELIRKNLKIPVIITNMSARHSFGTLLMRQNIPMQYIQRAYGHQYSSTTENHLGQYSDGVKKQYTQAVVTALQGKR